MVDKHGLRAVSGGRPSSYSEEVAAEICALIAGGESLRSICDAPGRPARSTVIRWLAENQTFRDQYARARQDQAELIFEAMAEIEDEVRSGKLEAQSARVILQNQQWRLARMSPRRFGDKLQLAGDPDAPVIVQREQSPLELARSVAFCIAMAKHSPPQIEETARPGEPEV